jgi:hypothetical protein
MEHNPSEKKRQDGDDDSQRQDSGKWTELLTQLVDKMTGKDVSIKYEFHNLEIDVPKATGPGGQELGSARWMINGNVIISSKVEGKEG